MHQQDVPQHHVGCALSGEAHQQVAKALSVVVVIVCEGEVNGVVCFLLQGVIADMGQDVFDDVLHVGDIVDGVAHREVEVGAGREGSHSIEVDGSHFHIVCELDQARVGGAGQAGEALHAQAFPCLLLVGGVECRVSNSW